MSRYNEEEGEDDDDEDDDDDEEMDEREEGKGKGKGKVKSQEDDDACSVDSNTSTITEPLPEYMYEKSCCSEKVMQSFEKYEPVCGKRVTPHKNSGLTNIRNFITSAQYTSPASLHDYLEELQAIGLCVCCVRFLDTMHSEEGARNAMKNHIVFETLLQVMESNFQENKNNPPSTLQLTPDQTSNIKEEIDDALLKFTEHLINLMSALVGVRKELDKGDTENLPVRMSKVLVEYNSEFADH